jgi:hypothetical protein
LPIHLRRFYIKQIVKVMEDKNKRDTEQHNARKKAMPTFRPK